MKQRSFYLLALLSLLSISSFSFGMEEEPVQLEIKKLWDGKAQVMFFGRFPLAEWESKFKGWAQIYN